ncbi:MAG: PSD1 and planctomycete cytochrome C domain-containing protein [bacterium]
MKLRSISLFLLIVFQLSGSNKAYADENQRFNDFIRPILQSHCISCHNPEKAKGGLDLTSHAAALAGGESGHVIIPGKPEKSLIMEVLGYEGDIQMPPAGKLSIDSINTIGKWISSGAAWPEGVVLKSEKKNVHQEMSDATGPQLRAKPFQLSAEDKTWWSFQPIRDTTLPRQSSPNRSNPVDRFIFEKLTASKLQPNPAASRRELIRRAYYDLLGLPPSPEAVKRFENDMSPEAWPNLIDELLASPHYGERWGRHWLDLVRFAETNGYERDGTKPFAWRYRDYIIDSFNSDKPYDQFITEQLAGDEMPGKYALEKIIATGYYRLHVWDDEPDSTLTAEFDDLDDIMVTTGATFLGLTIGCARCHDHKYDPIRQSDYYSMLAHFRSINPYGLHKTGGGGRGTGKITKILASDDQLQHWENEKKFKIDELKMLIGKSNDTLKINEIKDQIKKMENEIPFEQALAVNEDPVKPTFIFRRGDAHAPAEEVTPAFPRIFSLKSPEIKPSNGSSGRRLAMARWIASKDNPLTARVIVNRLWQHHFGRGIVPSANDFGRTGEMPSHPELLDFLASRLIAGGFKIKAMHRLIMTSQTYQMSSRADNAKNIAIDEPNRYFWRQNPRRLEAEALRDSLLVFSGNLNRKAGGPGFFPALSEEIHRTQDSVRKGWQESSPEEQNRRSVYIFAKRALVPPILETFDCPSTTVPIGNRPVTTVAPQALMLLNDQFVQKQADDLSRNILKLNSNDIHKSIKTAFECVLQRGPTDHEMQLSKVFLNNHVLHQQKQESAFRQFCLALFNLNEVIYVD